MSYSIQFSSYSPSPYLFRDSSHEGLLRQEVQSLLLYICISFYAIIAQAPEQVVTGEISGHPHSTIVAKEGIPELVHLSLQLLLCLPFTVDLLTQGVRSMTHPNLSLVHLKACYQMVLWHRTGLLFRNLNSSSQWQKTHYEEHLPTEMEMFSDLVPPLSFTSS